MLKDSTNTSYPTSTTTIPYTATSKKVSPSTMEEAISVLKKQSRDQKLKNAQLKEAHSEEVAEYQRQIQKMKKKIVYMHERQYLKNILDEDEEQELQYKYSNDEKLKQMRVLNQKLQVQIQNRDRTLHSHQQTIELLKGEVEKLQREKSKHVELSVIEKINLEERIEILQREIQSKKALLKMSSEGKQQFTQKQIKLKKIERKLAKKAKQLSYAEKQLSEYNQFEVSKIKMRLQSTEEENSFLKAHISRLESKIMEVNCHCSCTKDVSLFKNKYINKSKELSKIKVELSKEMFKEKFMRQHNSQNAPKLQVADRVHSEYERGLKELKSQGKFLSATITGGHSNSHSRQNEVNQSYNPRSTTVKKFRKPSSDVLQNPHQINEENEDIFFNLSDTSDVENEDTLLKKYAPCENISKVSQKGRQFRKSSFHV